MYGGIRTSQAKNISFLARLELGSFHNDLSHYFLRPFFFLPPPYNGRHNSDPGPLRKHPPHYGTRTLIFIAGVIFIFFMRRSEKSGDLMYGSTSQDITPVKNTARVYDLIYF